MSFINHLVAASFLLLLLVLVSANKDDLMSGGASYPVIELSSADGRISLPHEIDCDGACSERCRLSSRPNLCKRACGTCCKRCDCVPPGTSGNYDACPCYGNMTTHGGRHKCP